MRTLSRGDLMEPPPATGLPHHRTIIALDIAQSTTRTDPVKAELRNKIYELFDEALRSAGIHAPHRDPFIDRGDGVLALIHPVEEAQKALLLNYAIPAVDEWVTMRCVDSCRAQCLIEQLIDL